jgi:hypothetical protein
VEITAENAVLGLRAGHSNGFSSARTGLTDAAMGEFAKAGGRRMPPICKGQRQQLAANQSKVQRIKACLSRKNRRAWFGFAHHKCSTLQRESA